MVLGRGGVVGSCRGAGYSVMVSVIAARAEVSSTGLRYSASPGRCSTSSGEGRMAGEVAGGVDEQRAMSGACGHDGEGGGDGGDALSAFGGGAPSSIRTFSTFAPTLALLAWNRVADGSAGRSVGHLGGVMSWAYEARAGTA